MEKTLGHIAYSKWCSEVNHGEYLFPAYHLLSKAKREQWEKKAIVEEE